MKFSSFAFQISILIFSLSFCLACKNETSSSKIASKKVVIPFKKDGVLTLKKATSDSIITTLDIEIANTEYDIQTGLMYRTTLKANHGMLFIFPNEDYRSFYMKNTRIPLDIVELI